MEGSVEPGAASTADLVVHLADLHAAEEESLGRPVSWEEALATMLTRYRSCRRHALLRLPGLQRLLAPRKQRARPAEQAQSLPDDERMRGEP